MNFPPIIDQTRPDQTRPDQTGSYAQNYCNRKVLLVTLFGNSNYGNILQRIALSRTIESLGFDVTHLCCSQAVNHFPVIKFIKRAVKLLLAILGVRKYRKKLRERPVMRKINSLFSSFQNKYVTRRVYSSLSEVLSAGSSQWQEYDYAVTGSDQVWHLWQYNREEAGYFYLSFMPREKRVCYAPSFGFTEFLPETYELHREGLSGFDRLSCRESGMIPMIRQAVGKDAQLVLDPTLLLTASQWREYTAKPDYDVPEKFMLCYFLGSKPPEYVKAVHECANGLPVISMLDHEDKAHILTNPGAFLWLIDHADFVCTDSFHGTAFSVNFGKNFLAFRRRQKNMENMFGRIDDLLSSLNINGHVYGERMTLRPLPVNYDDVSLRLEAMRDSSMQYLRQCLR